MAVEVHWVYDDTPAGRRVLVDRLLLLTATPDVDHGHAAVLADTIGELP